MNTVAQLLFWLISLLITFVLVYYILDKGLPNVDDQTEKFKVTIAIMLLFALFEVWREIWDRIKYYICDTTPNKPVRRY